MRSLAIRGGSVEVLVEGPRIAAVGTQGTERASTVVDATGCAVLPGFVDLQVNGAVGVDLTTQPERIGEVAAFLVQCGVTSFMPTVISASAADTAAAVAVMHEWSHASCRGARSLGVHLEGPFLNPTRAGAHPIDRLRAPSVDEVDSWRRDTGIAMVTIAPELPQAAAVIARLVTNGVAVCAGHTDADVADMRAAIDAGLVGVTHLFNAMSPIAARRPGVAGTALVDQRLIAGLIVDGLHVDPTMVLLAWRALGPNRIAMVTDAMSALGLPHGDYCIGETPVVVGEQGARTAAGVLAGSVLRFDQAVRNLMEFTGCDVAEASIAASATPARLARRDDIGALEPGRAADVVLLDEQYRVVVTLVGGRVEFDPQQRCSDCGGR